MSDVNVEAGPVAKDCLVVYTPRCRTQRMDGCYKLLSVFPMTQTEADGVVKRLCNRRRKLAGVRIVRIPGTAASKGGQDGK
jgi:hypothetical protein